MTNQEQRILNNLKKIWIKNTKRLVKINQAPSYSVLADEELKILEETRPDKNKTLEENCNAIQTEFIKYLKLVRDTNEL